MIEGYTIELRVEVMEPLVSTVLSVPLLSRMSIMRIKKTIFGSGNEKELFQTINSNWSDKFDVYPSLPYTTIIDFLNEQNLSQQEKNFLKKANVDYTVCTKEGEPLLSIEFDGMGHGFSKLGEYVQITYTTDPMRSKKLTLKLKIANGVGYPFFIVSYDEKNCLKGESLTIVDGIIGCVLAKKHFLNRIQELGDEHSDEIKSLAPHEEYEFVQDLVLSAEVEADLEWNPIVQKAYEYESQLNAKSMGFEYLTDPDLPDIKDMFDFDGLAKRIKAFDKVKRVGCKVTVKTSRGELFETAWMRNIEGFGVSATSLVREIAELLAYKKALTELGEIVQTQA